MLSFFSTPLLTSHEQPYVSLHSSSKVRHSYQGLNQIFESGSAASHTLLYGPARESAWQSFVAGVPECASSINTTHTFSCLRAASTEELFNATSLTLAEIQMEFPFSPVIDGSGGIIPDFPSRLFTKGEFARIPFISGTNLDEGTY